MSTTVVVEATAMNVLIGTDYAGFDCLLPAGRPRPDTAIPYGVTWLCPIDVIFEHGSIDGANPNHVCAIGEDGEEDDDDWEDRSWDELLMEKRGDYCYQDVLESLTEFGFVRPVTLSMDTSGNDWLFGDGHHRLAAAFDLGWKHVPVMAGFTRSQTIADDSGDWDRNARIPLNISGSRTVAGFSEDDDED